MSEENVEIVRDAYERWNRGEFGWTETEISRFAPGFEYVPAPLVGLSETVQGLDGFMRFLQQFWEQFDDARVEPEEFIESGDSVLAVVMFRASGKQSGVDVNMEVFQLWTLRDGKVIRGHGFFDREEALEAAGLSEQAMSEENLELVRKGYEAANRGDFEGVNVYFHPEIEFHTYAQSPEAGVYRGKEDVQKYNESLFQQFESVRFEIDELLDAGDRVVAVTTQHAVPKGGREEMSVQITEVWMIRDGLLAERRSFPTRAEALEAAGLSE